jgi:hypothetical protein
MDFKVKCVGYTSVERAFTIGKVYDVINGEITSDRNYTYSCWSNHGSTGDFKTLKKWFEDYYIFELVEDTTVFSKKDLKNGDFVLRENGTEEVFIEHLGAFCGKDGFMPLSKVNDDLTHTGLDKGWNIVKVRRPTQICHCQFDVPSFGELVYDRERDTEKLYKGKVVCIDNFPGNNDLYTVGKIYQFKDGKLISDKGDNLPHSTKIYTFEDWKEFSSSKWIEVKE